MKERAGRSGSSNGLQDLDFAWLAVSMDMTKRPAVELE